MQGTRVRALVWEDPTCHGATKLVHHNYWARVPQLATTPEARMPTAQAPQQTEATAMRSRSTATKSSPRLLQLEKAHAQQRRPNATKNKLKKKNKTKKKSQNSYKLHYEHI